MPQVCLHSALPAAHSRMVAEQPCLAYHVAIEFLSVLQRGLDNDYSLSLWHSHRLSASACISPSEMTDLSIRGRKKHTIHYVCILSRPLVKIFSFLFPSSQTGPSTFCPANAVLLPHMFIYLSGSDLLRQLSVYIALALPSADLAYSSSSFGCCFVPALRSPPLCSAPSVYSTISHIYPPHSKPEKKKKRRKSKETHNA